MAKVVFHFDFDKECEIVQSVIKENILDSLLNKLNNKDALKGDYLDWQYPKNLKEKVQKSSKKQGIAFVKDFLKSRYYEKQPLIMERTGFIEKKWRSVEKDFFEITNKRLGYGSKYKQYNCYVTSFQPYGRSTYKTNIFIPDKLTPNKENGVFIDLVVHELLHHYLNQFYKIHTGWFKERGINRNFWIDTICELLIPIISYWSELSGKVTTCSGLTKWESRFEQVMSKYNLKENWEKKCFNEFAFFLSECFINEKSEGRHY